MRTLRIPISLLFLLLLSCGEDDFSAGALSDYIRYDKNYYLTETAALIHIDEDEIAGRSEQYLSFSTDEIINSTDKEGTPILVPTGFCAYFRIYSSERKKLNVGTYQFDEVAWKGEDVMVFDQASFYYDFELDYQVQMNSGSIVVEEKGSGYRITFTCQGENEIEFSGVFEGVLEQY